MANVFFELFESLPRQGPGDDESTTRAYGKLAHVPTHAHILDVGCGSGAQTLVLAQLTCGEITALDNHPPFIEKLRRHAEQRGLSHRIHCVVGDMTAMNFPKESFDVIWSEGAAYVMGFENALRSWTVFLKPKGYLVASELVWFRKGAPQEIADYFGREYPDMKYHEDVCVMARSCGYEVVDYFPLPAASWWVDYYTPAEKKIEEMRRECPDDSEAQSIISSFELEMDMHRRYSEYYGYGFYVMREAG